MSKIARQLQPFYDELNLGAGNEAHQQHHLWIAGGLSNVAERNEAKPSITGLLRYRVQLL